MGNPDSLVGRDVLHRGSGTFRLLFVLYIFLYRCVLAGVYGSVVQDSL